MVEVACLLGTLLAYKVGLVARGRTTAPWVNPTLIAILLVGAVVGLVGLDYEEYDDATRPISILLGPAVVALAIPLHREREVLLRHARALAAGAALGALAAMGIGWGAAALLSLDPDFTLALESRTATSPISIAIAEELGRAPALSAVMSIASGIFGATFAPALLTRLGVRADIARGLAMGVSAHGIGTARMLEESRSAGAASSVGMGLGGLVVALVLPPFAA